MQGGESMAAGPLDPRQDTIDALNNMFESEDVAKAFETGIMKVVYRALQPLDLNLCWMDSHLLQMYTYHVRHKIGLLRKYPEKIKEIEQLATLLDVELEAQKESFTFVPKVWEPERKNQDILQKKLDFRKSSDIITCPACKQKKCTIKLVQTRSADEPATMFISCMNCGKKWRESSA